jgi:hypothetical protein
MFTTSQDKKARYYVISALSSTKIDLKVLSARLGLGKGGIRMADPESVEEVLKVCFKIILFVFLCTPRNRPR